MQYVGLGYKRSPMCMLIYYLCTRSQLCRMQDFRVSMYMPIYCVCTRSQLGTVYDYRSPMHMLNVLFMYYKLAKNGVRLEKTYVHIKCTVYVL